MKKILSLLLVIMCLIGCCSCSPKQSDREIVETMTDVEVRSYFMRNYDASSVEVTKTLTKVNDDTYNVSGKAIVEDKYGDLSEVKYDAVVEREDEEYWTVTSVEFKD